MGGLVTAFQPNAILNPHNTRQIRNPMRPKQRQEILESHCFIYNLTPQSWGPIYRTHGAYQVFGINAIDIVPEELLDKRYGFGEVAGIPYSWLQLNGRIELVENGIESGRGVSYDEVATEADLIAQDITDWCNQNRPGTEAQVPSFIGVFWELEGPEPSEKAIKSAQKRLFAYYRALVEEGDKIWSEKDTNTGVKVETLMKTAFRTLKSAGKLAGDKPWVFDPAPAPSMEACKACKSPIPQGALRCTHCHAFQTTDMRLLREFFPGDFPEGAKMGKQQTLADLEKGEQPKPIK